MAVQIEFIGGRNVRKLLWIVIALTILSTLALPVFAQGGGDGKVVFGGSFTLDSGETLGDDLVVLGGTATLEEDSLVKGTVAVLGGRVSVAGEVDGDLVVIGGQVQLKETARIEGQLVNFGAGVDKASGAVILGGETVGPIEFDIPGPWSSQRWSPVGSGGWGDTGGRFVLNMMWGVVKDVGRAVLLTIIGLLIILFWEKPTEQVGAVVVAKPLPSLGVGILSILVAFCVGLILLIAACSGLLVWLAAMIAWMLGWTAAGLMVGQRVLAAFKVEPTPPLATIVGVALISLIWAFPCMGALFAFIVGAAGLGAVVLTRAGTQSYPPTPILTDPPEESLAFEE
jgi:hypothetical protein